MAPRKRHGGNQNGRQEKEDRVPQRSQATHKVTTRSGVSPVLASSLLILLIVVTGAVYVYNFTDVIGTLQTRFATFITPESSIPQHQSESPTHEQQNSQKPEDVPPATDTQKKTADIPKTKTESKKPYAKQGITSAADNKIRRQLDEADSKLDKGRLDEALSAFDALLVQHSQSPRARYGRAHALDKLSEQQQSNSMLEQCIDEYTKLLSMDQVPKELLILTGRRCAERQTFRGWALKATKTMQTLVAKYPMDVMLHNDLGIAYLMAGRSNNARQAFKAALDIDPNDGVALVHYGFILKTTDDKISESISYLQRGLDSGHKGTIDGRFIFHLGDAYYRNGQHNKSYEVYQLGVENGVFLSKWQRSLYNVDRLTGRPFWTLEQTTVARKLKNLAKHWKMIRDEGLAQLNEDGGFMQEDENLRQAGIWKQLTLYSRGRKNEQMCALAPNTCALIDQIPEAAGCKRGQVKFSVMHAGTHVWPHCGPTNCRLRAHLGLVVPEGPQIRVAEQLATWKEGEFLIFDDSFEHEVWHGGEHLRLILIVDIWHPELTSRERNTLSPI